MRQQGMKVIYKVWVANSGEIAFGEGPYRLLKGVEATGSLMKAATAMGMAYSKARRLIMCCERNLGFVLTSRKIGGVSGGGSQLTAQAAELLRKYEAFVAEAEEAIGETYQKTFGEPAQVQFYSPAPRKRRRKPAQ
jgi:molybdate transport system regulatory protein